MNLKNSIKIIITIALLSLTCSCQVRLKKPGDDFQDELKGASADFKQGWNDGCDSGSASGTAAFNQMFHKNNNIDGYKMSYSPDYSTAWNNAWWYCYRKDWTNQRSTVWGSIFGGYK